ncbi:hypothetical protein VitviT2T_029380 [Vitis vinifera]|uniref:Uncharacterized protein n=1 Tax=Vitis vinifera TaxID=29760 RepID=A0ABY9DWW8_VITVI|nr:hypothetical protein VitviT2T_029380 [Vitis vinifera]
MLVSHCNVTQGISHVRSLCAACARPVRGLCAACARPVRGLCKTCARPVHDLCAACARGLGRGSGSVVEARFARFRRAGDALQERHVLPTPFRGASDAVPV